MKAHKIKVLWGHDDKKAEKFGMMLKFAGGKLLQEVG